MPLVGNTHLNQVLKPVSAKDALYVESEANTLSVVFQFLRESGFAPEDAIRKLNHDGEKGIQRRNDCKFLVKKQLGKHKSQIVPTLWDETYMMDDRPAMMRLPHCSAQALAAILKDIKDNGMPEGGTSRRVFKDARNLQNATHTPFGKILQTISVIDKDDAEQQLTIAHPIALLWVASSECSSFSMFFLAKLKETPPSIDKPWRLVAYTDEVTPGNPLQQKNNRKFHAFYWSFLEFGVSALSREEAWFTATTEYSVHVSGLSAGLSQVVGSIFKLFFSGGINLAVTAVLHFNLSLIHISEPTRPY